ncbi:alpha/beta fold hydrolase [Streptomyces bohaiensis]|uniref:Alpha/beta fold hydrolase n=1 Tax=Streptomyces bohaiensis TaxID=1431344 RepID=A0ABX1C8A0_9ACTN|nr:alpha/beta fold hydrolase [Streptomyces bohaiensis]NJQ13825.1 alpha/beta fold hydrolase [Streptomyces bohaiensis]
MSTTAEPVRTVHRVPTSDGQALHVEQVAPPTADDRSPGVLLLPGLFSDTRFFLGPDGRGPAAALLAEGHICYLAAFRGHGPGDPGPGRSADWNVDTYVRHDVPDLLRAVGALHPGPLFLLAHSMAGYVALAALATRPELQQRLAAVVTVASAVNDYSDGGIRKRAHLTFAAAVSRLLGRFPARALRQGRHDEPAGLMRQLAAWAPRGAFRSADGNTDYWAQLAAVTLPVLVVVGAADTFHASPARARRLADHLGEAAELRVLGRSTGLGWDPGHVDILRGARADAEVMPRLTAWMRAAASRGGA